MFKTSAISASISFSAMRAKQENFQLRRKAKFVFVKLRVT